MLRVSAIDTLLFVNSFLLLNLNIHEDTVKVFVSKKSLL